MFLSKVYVLCKIYVFLRVILRAHLNILSGVADKGLPWLIRLEWKSDQKLQYNRSKKKEALGLDNEKTLWMTNKLLCFGLVIQAFLTKRRSGVSWLPVRSTASGFSTLVLYNCKSLQNVCERYMGLSIQERNK